MRSELQVPLDEIHLVIANSFLARVKGLLGRRSLSAEQALWFKSCRCIHTFGMKFELAVHFIDKDHKIIRSCPRVAAGRILICLGASSVVEMAACSTERAFELQRAALQKALTHTRDQTQLGAHGRFWS